MKKLIFLTAIILGFALPVFAQTEYIGADSEGRPVFQIADVTIHGKMSKRARRRYEKKVKKFNKLRYNVIKVWPYANEAAANLMEINDALENVPEAEQEEWLKNKEESLFGEFEDDIRDMTRSQGKILIKLIDRQCGVTTYSLVKDLKSGASAFFWQGIGRVFGYNLKTEYNPTEDDKEIEFIVRSLESGENPTYYDMQTTYVEF